MRLRSFRSYRVVARPLSTDKCISVFMRYRFVSGSPDFHNFGDSPTHIANVPVSNALRDLKLLFERVEANLGQRQQSQSVADVLRETKRDHSPTHCQACANRSKWMAINHYSFALLIAQSYRQVLMICYRF